MINKNPINKLITKIDNYIDEYEKKAFESGISQSYVDNKLFVHRLDDIKMKLKEIEKNRLQIVKDLI